MQIIAHAKHIFAMENYQHVKLSILLVPVFLVYCVFVYKKQAEKQNCIKNSNYQAFIIGWKLRQRPMETDI